MPSQKLIIMTCCLAHGCHRPYVQFFASIIVKANARLSMVAGHRRHKGSPECAARTRTPFQRLLKDGVFGDGGSSLESPAAIPRQNRHRFSRCQTGGRPGENNLCRVERSDLRLPVVVVTSKNGVLRRPVESAHLPIDRRRMKLIWRREACARASTAKGRQGKPCRDILLAPTAASRRSVLASSMRSPLKKGRWGSSCERSTSPGQR